MHNEIGWHGFQMAMLLGMVDRYDVISPDVYVSTRTTIYHITIQLVKLPIQMEGGGEENLQTNIPYT